MGEGGSSPAVSALALAACVDASPVRACAGVDASSEAASAGGAVRMPPRARASKEENCEGAAAAKSTAPPCTATGPLGVGCNATLLSPPSPLSSGIGGGAGGAGTAEAGGVGAAAAEEAPAGAAASEAAGGGSARCGARLGVTAWEASELLLLQETGFGDAEGSSPRAIPKMDKPPELPPSGRMTSAGAAATGTRAKAAWVAIVGWGIANSEPETAAEPRSSSWGRSGAGGGMS
mmetsp:Transcript_101208/g.325155  ORF Transcript_101208/g.325155 Transcript_101208/m.325155 type:complete len:234 (+) Transcript_101208:1416-2117(+)